MIDFFTLNDLTFFAFTGVDPYKGANIRQRLKSDKNLRNAFNDILKRKNALLSEEINPGKQAIQYLMNYAGSLMVIKVKGQHNFNVVMN